MQTSLDGKIAALVPGVTSALQMGLQDVLRTLRDGQNPVGVLLAMSRLRLRLMEEVFAGVGHKLPSDTLYDCIVTAARGDPQIRASVAVSVSYTRLWSSILSFNPHMVPFNSHGVLLMDRKVPLPLYALPLRGSAPGPRCNLPTYTHGSTAVR